MNIKGAVDNKFVLYARIELLKRIYQTKTIHNNHNTVIFATTSTRHEIVKSIYTLVVIHCAQPTQRSSHFNWNVILTIKHDTTSTDVCEA